MYSIYNVMHLQKRLHVNLQTTKFKVFSGQFMVTPRDKCAEPADADSDKKGGELVISFFRKIFTHFVFYSIEISGS